MYHAACKVEFQPFTVVLTADVFQFFKKSEGGGITQGENLITRKKKNSGRKYEI